MTTDTKRQRSIRAAVLVMERLLTRHNAFVQDWHDSKFPPSKYLLSQQDKAHRKRMERFSNDR